MPKLGDLPEDLMTTFEFQKAYCPPEELKSLGDFRSPLLFNDGTKVLTSEQWPLRRREIFNYWHEVIGHWPCLLQNPSFSVLQKEQKQGYCRFHISLMLAPSQKQKAWLLVPNGQGPFPAVLVVFYDPETSAGLKRGPQAEHRDYGLQLVKAGFVTLNIGTPSGSAWKPELGQAQCQPLSFYAYVAANAWNLLASMPQVNARRIGIMGHSYGGKWALFAGAFWEKFAAVAVSDPGIVWDETRPNVNYWEPWYLGLDKTLHQQRKPGVPGEDKPRTGAYKTLIEDGHDLVDLHALICPRPFLVSGGSEDPAERWLALNHARQINTLLGIKEERIGMTNRAQHSPDSRSNAAIRTFFELFLKTF